MGKDTLQSIRLNSKYFQLRKNKMYYQGSSENIKNGRYLVTSEETLFMMLPLIKYAKDTKSNLFFCERGAYSQTISVKFLKKLLGLDIVIHSYKLTNTKKDSKTINKELSDMLKEYIKEYFSKSINQKLSQQDILKLEELKKNIANMRDFNIHNYKYKINLLSDLIKSEFSNILDPIRDFIFKNRADKKGSLNYRANHGKEDIILREEDFGNNPSKYRKEIFNSLKFKFPKGINCCNHRDFFYETNYFNREYMKKHFQKISFVSFSLINYILKSMRIKMKNVIYCDDGIANGFTYFCSKLFHLLIGDGEFRFNIYTHPYKPISLGETQTTTDTDFYEDIPEVFDFYYSGLKRIKYKREKISTKEKESYNLFIKYLTNLIDKSPNLIKILEDIDNKTYIKCRFDKEKRYLSILFFLIDPNFFNEEILRLYGHNSSVNYSEHIIEREDGYKIEKLLLEIKDKYENIKAIRKKVCINILLEEHKKYLLKLKKFENFFKIYKKEILDYINSKPIDLKILSNSKKFVSLAKLFYNYIDSLKIAEKDMPYGY